jgi:hypothetical protein
LNVQSLDLTSNGAVLGNSDHTNLGKQQTIVEKVKTCLRVSETTISPVAFKTRVARLFATCFYSAKEGLESQVNPCANFL